MDPLKNRESVSTVSQLVSRAKHAAHSLRRTTGMIVSVRLSCQLPFLLDTAMAADYRTYSIFDFSTVPDQRGGRHHLIPTIRPFLTIVVWLANPNRPVTISSSVNDKS